MEIKLTDKITSKNKKFVYLNFEIDKNFTFKAWQFVILDNEVFKRSYSIASSPSELKNKRIWFFVKLASENGMSKFLTQDLKIWNKIKLLWPFWHMVLPEEKNCDYLFISTWSGLAPMLSLYKYLIETGNFSKIYNIFGERYFENIIPSCLNNMQNSEQIQNTFFLSKDKHKDFKFWHIQKEFDKLENFFDDLKKIKTYICWNPKIVKNISEELINLWIEKENIKIEKY